MDTLPSGVTRVFPASKWRAGAVEIEKMVEAGPLCLHKWGRLLDVVLISREDWEKLMGESH
jgi:PHD/YefM family antitoxin component YafN of YafNO toxin-antitoxin module